MKNQTFQRQFASRAPHLRHRGQIVLAAGLIALMMGQPRANAETAIPGGHATRDVVRTLAGKLGAVRRRQQEPHCAATCLSSSLIATAGHCIRTADGGAHADDAPLQFQIVPTSQWHTGSAQKQSTTIITGLVSGGTQTSLRAPIGADRDWVILRLREPICKHGGVAFAGESERNVGAATEGPIYVSRLSRSRQGRLQVSVAPCRSSGTNWTTLSPEMTSDFADASQLLFHHCDAGSIASGAVLVRLSKIGSRVIAMHVGTYVRSRVLEENNVITRRLSSRPVANIAVKTAAFTRPVADIINKDAR